MNHAQKTKLFNQMYEKHYPRLIRNIPKLTFDYGERDDIAQETFQRVWQALKAGQYEELADPFTWIYKIAIGASQRLLQNKQRQIPVHIDIEKFDNFGPPEESEDAESVFTTDPQEFEGGLVDYDTPEIVAMRTEAEEQLDGQVHELDDHYREILALHYYDGKSYEEISVELDTSVETIRTRLRRARDQLKALLGEEDEQCEASDDSPPDSHEGGRGGIR